MIDVLVLVAALGIVCLIALASAVLLVVIFGRSS